MTDTLKTNMVAINKWFYWCYNYEYDFIEKIWGKKEMFNLAEHLQNKFDSIYDSYGSRAVMNQFYAELDNSNRVKLLEYVLNSYNGECKLYLED